jgi:predicted FMN-binding regulatory protein PaiB|tara:strand:+ start:356 stop:673 length:318 start_codon:yes stop_codon:yes gene_type:complete
METDDKKLSTLKKVLENLTHPTVSSGSTVVDFKKNPDDIVQTLGADTDAILITYERDKGELKLYHNGIEIDKAVFAKQLKAETGFYALFDYLQDKFKSWRTAWMS